MISWNSIRYFFSWYNVCTSQFANHFKTMNVWSFSKPTFACFKNSPCLDFIWSQRLGYVFIMIRVLIGMWFWFWFSYPFPSSNIFWFVKFSSLIGVTFTSFFKFVFLLHNWSHCKLGQIYITSYSCKFTTIFYHSDIVLKIMKGSKICSQFN